MAERPLSVANAILKAQEDTADVRLAKAREKIRKNFPNARAPLTWRKESATRIVSNCGRFAIDKHGEGEGVRYTARKMPHSIIGNRRFTLEQAKEDCCRHASPLPLEPPPAAAAAPVVEREPGSDDNL